MEQKENQTVELTYEQLKFYEGKRRLQKYKNIKLQRPLTYKEKYNEDQILETLWKMILKFATKEAHKIMEKYNLSNDAFWDVQQEMACIFYEKLDAYDPLKSTPTTYFVRYFRQVITEYLLTNSQNLSQYDANNLKKVRSAINYYESQGIQWTEEMITSKTSLSAKVVKSTIYYGTNSKHASIEDALELKSRIPTPEEAFRQKESSNVLYEALIRVKKEEDITDEDLNLLIMRVNVNGSKEMPYETIAKQTGLPIKYVKARLNKLICKLNQDEQLCAEFGKQDNRDTVLTAPMKFQDRSADIMEKQLWSFLDGTDL